LFERDELLFRITETLFAPKEKEDEQIGREKGMRGGINNKSGIQHYGTFV
jgi:hypothetical protein